MKRIDWKVRKYKGKLAMQEHLHRNPPKDRSLSSNRLMAFDGTYYEPVKRMCAGKMQYVHHRFPIKGGITFCEAWSRDIKDALSAKSFFLRQEAD
jgi:hypothetical protein